MHIPDAVLSTPVMAVSGAVGVLGFGYALSRLKSSLGERLPVLMGLMSASLFAAQMVNFPVFPGISGHLLGGVLAAVLLGPWAGAVVVGAVLIVQCLLFADGGLLALGANFVNMGLIGSVLGYAVYAPVRRAIGGPSGVLVGSMVAAWFSVIMAACALSVELAASVGFASFLPILGWMTLVHAAIGLGEAIITGLILQPILLVRPDFVHGEPHEGSKPVRWGQVAVLGLVVSLAVAAFLAPWASESPDGFEYVAGKLRVVSDDEAEPAVESPMPDYQMPGLPNLKLATAAAGMVGTLIVFGFGLTLARSFERRIPPGEPRAALPGGVGSDAT